MPGTGDNRTVFEAASRPQRSLYRFASLLPSPLCDTLHVTAASALHLVFTRLRLPRPFFATAHTRCHSTDTSRALPPQSLLIQSILTRRSIPGSRPLSACTFVATVLG